MSGSSRRTASTALQATECLEALEHEFKTTGRAVDVKFRDLCADWPWAKRSDVYTHLIHPYSAKVIPYIPILFLSTEKYARRDDAVADIFAGTGTVLLESIIHPFFPRAAYGVEINPLARLIANVKVTPLDPQVLRTVGEDVLTTASASQRAHIPSYTQLDFWFPKSAQLGLGRIKRAIGMIQTPSLRDFFHVCLAACVRRCSFADPDIPPPVKLRPLKYAADTPWRLTAQEHLDRVETQNTFDVFRGVMNKNIVRMEGLWSTWKDNPTASEARVVWDDAKSLRWAESSHLGQLLEQTKPFPDASCGAIITSPPYGTAQKYVRNTKLEMLWLGQVRESDIASLDRATIGTEKAVLSEYSSIPSFPNPEINRILQLIKLKSAYRAALTFKYFSEMRDALGEAYRILRDRGALIMVIGNNMVAGQPVPNHELLTSLAEESGFTLEMVLRDKLQSRGMITVRHHTGGLVVDDWVVVLRKYS